MQHLIFTIALLISSALFAQNGEVNQIEKNSNITVTVVNALNNKGTIKFALYTKENFRKQPLLALSGNINEGKSTVVFKNVPTGNYAVVCFHDENENMKMDFNVNGMPIENYGVSNNVFTMGPPDFESSKFEVNNEDLFLEIKF